ncbi:MAG: energy-coupling factor transporter transmembrane protein EcfT, partial [Propionibacteriaceae bacterium]|nr:energy-coupling factor transporter transmembrane protein EcfT [Propionibacteriaceae bacterium]
MEMNKARGVFFLPRNLHPGAWWGWAIGCAVVASHTTNPVLLALVIAIAALTVVARRSNAPWALAFHLYVYLAVFIVALRIVFRIVFSADGPTILFNLPTLNLPGIFSSVSLFGAVSAEALLSAAVSGMQLATMVIAVGAANALANPKRLLAAVPGALYEWGTVVVIALSVFPQLAESLVRVRRARQLRADTGKGAHLIRHIAMPVLADGLERSLILAGTMDSRGYGRSQQVTPAARQTTSALLIASSFALCVGVYGLLDTGTTPPWMGVPMIVAGGLAGFIGLRLSGRRVQRTRYRPDPMAAPEWLVLGSGIAACIGVFAVGATQIQVLHPAVQP